MSGAKGPPNRRHDRFYGQCSLDRSQTEERSRGERPAAQLGRLGRSPPPPSPVPWPLRLIDSISHPMAGGGAALGSQWLRRTLQQPHATPDPDTHPGTRLVRFGSPFVSTRSSFQFQSPLFALPMHTSSPTYHPAIVRFAPAPGLPETLTLCSFLSSHAPPPALTHVLSLLSPVRYLVVTSLRAGRLLPVPPLPDVPPFSLDRREASSAPTSPPTLPGSLSLLFLVLQSIVSRAIASAVAASVADTSSSR